jgi:hypothetical protein
MNCWADHVHPVADLGSLEVVDLPHFHSINELRIIAKDAVKFLTLAFERVEPEMLIICAIRDFDF